MITNAEHIEIEGTGFCLVKIMLFEEWIIKKYHSLEKFNGLQRADKEKVFLRWKWGYEDDTMNDGLEISEKTTLRLFKDQDLSALSEPWRFHIEHKQNFDRICEETKQRIGLVYNNNPAVNKIAETFNAREY